MKPANTQGAPQAPISLLQQISEDADLRASLESDPVSFFAGYGLQVQSPANLYDIGDQSSDSAAGGVSQQQWLGLL